MTGSSGSIPPCMHTSVAPSTCASQARSATSGGQRIRVGVTLALRERAETAARVADVGEVDVAVHHERHVVADCLATKRISKRGNGFQRRPVGGRQREVLVVGAAAGVAFAEASAASTSVSMRSGARGGQLIHVCADRFPVTEGAVEIAAGFAVAAVSVDRRMEIDAGPATPRRRAPATAGPIGLTSRARPVAGSASAATCRDTRGSIQAAPAWTYLGWAVSRCTRS